MCLGLIAAWPVGLAVPSAQAAGILQVRKGYFWDPTTQQYFIPRGIAYQTWNPPVGADQSFEQLEYDLIEFKKMYANSVRCEMVWNQVERQEGAFDFSKPDFLVAKAEQLGLRLFVLIGFQYAPEWFTNHVGWQAVNDAGSNSVVLNYEQPEVRRVYSNYISRVTSRYRGSPAIGGWILGNEYAYFDLWNPDHRYLGFDPYSLASFRMFVSNQYGGNISALNARWKTNYTGFQAIAMPRVYPKDRHDPSYQDLTLWREHSIGEYVATGAVAARLADPNHVRSYSMIGGLFIGYDENYTCEDAKTIVARCEAHGAPLEFWSINNYAWATLTSELRSGDFGIAKHQAQSGLPVMVSETGHSTTDDLLEGAAQRQAQALPGQMWEALTAGAMGTHLFTWNDRDLFGEVFIRERGFGIVNQNRTAKPNQAYAAMVEAFRRMENLRLEELFGGSSEPHKDIQLFWSGSSLMGWPRANQENAMLWNALKRLGYQPGMLDDEQFAAGAYTDAAALLLSRCYQLEPAHLEQLTANVLGRGIHVHASGDLPGQFNAYHQPNPGWSSWMSSTFGLNVTAAVPGWDAGVSQPAFPDTIYRPIRFAGVTALGPLTSGYSETIQTWKIWHGITASSGTTVVSHSGLNNSQPPRPALQIKTTGTARTAINTFPLGDTSPIPGRSPTREWDVRYDWLRAIYRDHFGLIPAIDLAGPGAHYVVPDYRRCENGSILISLLNAYTNQATVTLTAHGLLDGRVVEDLTRGGILEAASDGIVTLSLAGDEWVLLYVYARNGGVDESIVNPNPNKLWIQSAPLAVWPRATGYEVAVGYDVAEAGLTLSLALEQLEPRRQTLSRVAPVAVTGKDSRILSLPVPDPDLNDPAGVSSRDGGVYVVRAWLEKDGLAVSDTVLPVRLLWSVRPASLPNVLTPGATYQIPVEWQELPSYEPTQVPWTLARADLWEPVLGEFEYYDVVLELRSNGQRVAADHFLTSAASGTRTFSVHVPPAAAGPFSWAAYLRPAPDSSPDVRDNFDQRGPGADPAFLAPWSAYIYPSPSTVRYLDGGIQAEGYGGSGQSAFLVVTNPETRGEFSGFYLEYSFPQTWALPTDFRQWTNYSFGFDFRENSRYACRLELQVSDDLGGALHFTKLYQPKADGWDSIQASLDRFSVIADAPFTGYFNLARVRKLIVNVQMLDTNVIYVGAFDNIRFNGMERPPPVSSSQDIVDSFEDRLRGEGPLFAPWVSYIYPSGEDVIYLNGGVHDQASDGSQAVFLAVQNPLRPPNPATFGLAYELPNIWALPSERRHWTNYVFSYDFKEANGHACQLEMQVKSGQNNWIQFVKPYAPGANGWDTIRASLDKFTTPNGVGAFDPDQVQTIALNVRMQTANVIYVASFDHVRLEAPKELLSPETGYGIFYSTNDTARVRSVTRNAAGDVVLSWSGPGRLQSADQITGPWSNLPAGTNTVVVNPSGARKFFRLAP